MSYQPNSPDPRTQNDQIPSDGQGNGVANETLKSSDLGGAHAVSQRERYVYPMGNQVDSHAEVFEDTNQSRANTRYWIARITYFVLVLQPHLGSQTSSSPFDMRLFGSSLMSSAPARPVTERFLESEELATSVSRAVGAPREPLGEGAERLLVYT